MTDEQRRLLPGLILSVVAVVVSSAALVLALVAR